MDFHCDGKVNYSEFLAATISTINFNKEEKLWSAFNYFDTTDSGYITLDSVMDALKNSGVIIDEEGLKKAFSGLQKKGEKINFNEFKAIALGKEMVEEEYELIKEEEQEEKKKLDYNNGNDNIDQNNSVKKLENIFENEEKKESQDILFEKINFSNLNKDINENKENKESKENKENNGNDNKNEEENNKNGNNKNENSNLNSNANSNANININNSNHKNNSKSNSKSNNKSSKSNNKSSKSNNKSSKSNNKSSKSNKSNMDVLIEEQSIDDNNDKFTEVNEVQN
jgi:hypothetical protein